jgi:hypothetical protein
MGDDRLLKFAREARLAAPPPMHGAAAAGVRARASRPSPQASSALCRNSALC